MSRFVFVHAHHEFEQDCWVNLDQAITITQRSECTRIDFGNGKYFIAKEKAEELINLGGA